MLIVAAGLDEAAQWAQIAQGTAALLSLVALVFLVRQTKLLTAQTDALKRAEQQSTKVAESTEYATLGGLMLGVDATFAAHSDLRHFAYGTAPLPPEGTPQRDRAALAAETILDLLDVYSESSRMMAEGGKDGWETFARDVYFSSEVVRWFWAERGRWYCPGLQRVMNKAAADHAAAATA